MKLPVASFLLTILPAAALAMTESEYKRSESSILSKPDMNKERLEKICIEDRKVRKTNVAHPEYQELIKGLGMLRTAKIQLHCLERDKRES